MNYDQTVYHRARRVDRDEEARRWLAAAQGNLDTAVALIDQVTTTRQAEVDDARKAAQRAIAKLYAVLGGKKRVRR